jgi:dimethylaniline monooxygenase (N-oxide forming)
MSRSPRAAVIGAGSSGIAAAKALHERGVPFTVFEASDRVGGNWVFGNRNGMSAAYRQLYINTSRDRMEYSDFPMPKSYPDYPHHTQIAAYFDAYVDHFGFRDRIRFETKVAHARRRDDGVWELELSDGSLERFDALLVANGHHWDPRWPEPMLPGHETFAGTQIHAHDYRDSDIFAGKHALVPGMGNSAMDIAVEASYVAERTFLAARRGAWILPKYVFGRPVDQLPNNPRVPPALRMKAFEALIRLHVGRPSDTGCRSPTTPSARRTRPSPDASSTACSTARSRRSRTSRAWTATTSSSPTGRASASTSSSTARATGSASRSSTPPSSPRPTTGSGCSGA